MNPAPPPWYGKYYLQTRNYLIFFGLYGFGNNGPSPDNEGCFTGALFEWRYRLGLIFLQKKGSIWRFP